MSRTMSSSISNEDDITLCFQTAREKLDRVDADAKEKKTQIVKDLAKDLEGKITTDRICLSIKSYCNKPGNYFRPFVCLNSSHPSTI